MTDDPQPSGGHEPNVCRTQRPHVPDRDLPRSPSVSIAMATYDGARYLAEQLASIVRQTHRPDELIVSDDASTDGTLEVVEAFARTAPFRVEVVRNATRAGYVRNFERALARCAGDVVFFCDQDDVWRDDKVARVLGAFEAQPAALLVIHDLVSVGSDLGGVGTRALRSVRSLHGTDASYVAGCASALRRDLVTLALPFPSAAGIGHDAWVHALARELGARVVLEEPLITYRRHDANASEAALDPRLSGRAFRLRVALAQRRRTLAAAASGERFAALRAKQKVHEALADRLGRAERFADAEVAATAAARTRTNGLELAARLTALSAPGGARWGAVARLVRDGVYRGRSGFLHAALDLVTRTPREGTPYSNATTTSTVGRSRTEEKVVR